MVSELERKRQENIRANEQLLKQLEIEQLAGGVAKDRAKPKPKPRRPKKSDGEEGDDNSPRRSKRVKREPEPELPRRRSRRLEGLPSDFGKQESNAQTEIEIKREREDRERDRIEGEKKLQDVIQRGDWDTATSILSSLGSKLSQGDYFELATKTEGSGEVDRVRKQMADLQFDTRFGDNGIKLTDNRIFTMGVHPDPDSKIIMAGDKMGELGIWDASQEEETIYSFKVHSRAISKIHTAPKHPQKIYMSSYDGSIRVLDFQTHDCVEAYVHDTNPRDPVGVSDFSFADPNTIHFSTLDGQIGVYDIRQKYSTATIYQAHDKKIGGMCTSPNQAHLLATASLDRTMKVWDLRKVVLDHPEMVSEFQSRLSVSTVDWNRSGQIVCNGYADKISVFDTVEQSDPSVNLKHNCQTGRWVTILKTRWQQAPADGLEKFAIGNMSKYLDVFAADGQQLAHLDGETMTAVPAASSLHPTQNWAAGGSASGRVYLWH